LIHFNKLRRTCTSMIRYKKESPNVSPVDSLTGRFASPIYTIKTIQNPITEWASLNLIQKENILSPPISYYLFLQKLGWGFFTSRRRTIKSLRAPCDNLFFNWIIDFFFDKKNWIRVLRVNVYRSEREGGGVVAVVC
jgi:hypothetical protein